jgi:putative transposase
MSRLRRLVLSDRYFFITCRVKRGRRTLSESEFEALAREVRERRKQHGFLLTAWVFLPDHWHAILFPRSPLSISRVMEAIKVGSTLRINAERRERGLFWQPRFFDRALRTVKEYREKVDYIHQNPVKAGLVSSVPKNGHGRARWNTRGRLVKRQPTTPSCLLIGCSYRLTSAPVSDQKPQSL